MYEFPPFQTLEALVAVLRTRFAAFMLAQRHYLRFKFSHAGIPGPASSMLFSFDGEYSVVADPEGVAVDPFVQHVRTRLEDAVGMSFMYVISLFVSFVYIA